MSKTILVVDDERSLANTLAEILNRSGYIALIAYGASEAIEALRSTRVDLLISDIVMPEMDGIELAHYTAREHPETRILLMSGNAEAQQLMMTANPNRQEFDLLAKPVLPKEILAHIHTLLSSSA